MIFSFPDGYPDELLYSIAARYGEWRDYKAVKIFQAFFGTTSVKAVVDLPCRLNYLVSQLPPGHVYTSDTFIDNHTLLPYYAPFLLPARLADIQVQMRGQGRGDILLKLGLLGTGIKRPAHLQYCPECACADRQRYSETYWHRLHQAPGVKVCPTHHIWLAASGVSAQGLKAFISAEQVIPKDLPSAVDIDLTKQAEADFLYLAQETAWLLKQPCSAQAPEILRERYLQLLFEHGFATYSGNIRTVGLVAAFQARFSQVFLAVLDSDVTGKYHRNWIARLAQVGQTQLTLRHLLMLRFLGLTVEAFWGLSVSHAPFGTSPWECLNVICPFHHQPVIDTCLQGFSYKAERRPLGTFKCPHCGFTYIRTGPDQAPGDRQRYSKVKDYGPLWKNRLRELFAEGKTRPEMVQALGVGNSAIRTQARRLGLAQARVPKLPTSYTPEIVPQTEGIEQHRSHWLNGQQQSPELGTAALIELLPQTYHVLYRYDAAWLEAHKPPVDRAKGTWYRVDWSARDKAHLKRLKKAARKLRQHPGKPIWITTNRVAKEAGLGDGSLQRDLAQLPRCAKFLDSIRETAEAFAIRRIQWTVREYQQEEVLASRSQFIKRAGLSKAIQTEAVVQALDKALRDLQTGSQSQLK